MASQNKITNVSKSVTAKTSAKATAAKKPTSATPSDSTPANKKRPAKKSRLISSKLAYKGKVFSVFKDEVEEPGGHKNVREVIRHSGSVVILAVDETKDAADPEIIFERQYRHAAGQILVELPAGRLDPGESPLAGAKREMIEETGYRAKKWTLLTKYFASPGFLGEWMQIYLAQDIREGEATPEEDENIEVFRMPLSEAMGLVAENKIHDGKTLIGLMLFEQGRRSGKL